jgi:hypothetical protein
MAGHMGSRHRLARGTSGEARCGIGFRLTRSRMGSQRVPSHIRHLEHARACPRPTGLDGLSRTLVVRISFLEAGEHMLGAVRSPHCQCFLVLPGDFMTHAKSQLLNPAAAGSGAVALLSLLQPARSGASWRYHQRTDPVCSLSPRGTSGERAGEGVRPCGNNATGDCSLKPLSLSLSPLLRRGERGDASVPMVVGTRCGRSHAGFILRACLLGLFAI